MKSLLLAVTVSAAAFAAAKTAPKTVKITFPPSKTVVEAELALTQAEHEKGLMLRTSLASGRGMLFVFPEEDMHVFWMKNTLIDLDIVFIGADKKILLVYDKVPKSRKDTPDDKVARVPGFGRYVLELPAGYCAGHGIVKGSALEFRLPQPKAGK
ncbi:MAG: DUF192 domain-containing protein [Elusimicrobiales bacterium]